MKNTSMLLLTAVIAGLSGCARWPHRAAPAGPRSSYDQAFLIWFVHYHEQQDRMTQPCAVNETIRQELRDFCAQSDQQHTERIERLRHWLKDWYGQELPRRDPYPLWLARLQHQQFEQEFFREYFRDNDEGIEKSGQCVSKATHSELRDFCGRVNLAQKKTDQQLNMWRCDWFHQCK